MKVGTMLDKVLLLRLESSVEDGTLGVLYVNGRMVCFTLEPPMNHNIQNKSCIPLGKYRVVKDSTGKHRWWKVLNVPNRTNIEIHTGNTVKDTFGCILTGLKIGKLGKQRGVLESKEAMEFFNNTLGKDCVNFELEVANGYVC